MLFRKEKKFKKNHDFFKFEEKLKTSILQKIRNYVKIFEYEVENSVFSLLKKWKKTAKKYLFQKIQKKFFFAKISQFVLYKKTEFTMSFKLILKTIFLCIELSFLVFNRLKTVFWTFQNFSEKKIPFCFTRNFVYCRFKNFSHLNVKSFWERFENQDWFNSFFNKTK